MDKPRYPAIKTTEDVGKLHSESQQLRNRQFVLSTVGITSAGLSSWLIAKTDGLPAQAVATLFILVLLTVLFTWSFFLRSRIGQISRYLELRGASEWEPLFRDFSSRKGTKYVSQSLSVMVLYLLLCGLVLARFLAVSGPVMSHPLTIAVLVVAVIFAVICVTLTLTRKSFDAKAYENWKLVLDEHFPESSDQTSPASPEQITKP